MTVLRDWPPRQHVSHCLWQPLSRFPRSRVTQPEEASQPPCSPTNYLASCLRRAWRCTSQLRRQPFSRPSGLLQEGSCAGLAWRSAAQASWADAPSGPAEWVLHNHPRWSPRPSHNRGECRHRRARGHRHANGSDLTGSVHTEEARDRCVRKMREEAA